MTEEENDKLCGAS